MPGMRDDFTLGLRYLLLVVVPSAVALAVLAQPAVAVLVRGGFDARRRDGHRRRAPRLRARARTVLRVSVHVARVLRAAGHAHAVLRERDRERVQRVAGARAVPRARCPRPRRSRTRARTSSRPCSRWSCSSAASAICCPRPVRTTALQSVVGAARRSASSPQCAPGAIGHDTPLRAAIAATVGAVAGGSCTSRSSPRSAPTSCAGSSGCSAVAARRPQTCNDGLAPEHRKGTTPAPTWTPTKTSPGGTMAVRIVTDSASDLPQDVCDELGIEIVPLTIRFGDKEYVDRKELSTEAFWHELETLDACSPRPPRRRSVRSKRRSAALADAGADGIVCINLSAQLSATMQSAQVAAKALDGLCPIAIVDSKSASMGIGNLVLHAARSARPTGADLDDDRRETSRTRRDRQRILAALDTLEYLRKGGRIGGARALLGSMLSIKPIISVVDGAVDEAGKVRTREQGPALHRRSRAAATASNRSPCSTPARPTSTSSSTLLGPRVPDAGDRRRAHRAGDRRAHRTPRRSASPGSKRAERSRPARRWRDAERPRQSTASSRCRGRARRPRRPRRPARAPRRSHPRGLPAHPRQRAGRARRHARKR